MNLNSLKAHQFLIWGVCLRKIPLCQIVGSPWKERYYTSQLWLGYSVHAIVIQPAGWPASPPSLSSIYCFGVNRIRNKQHPTNNNKFCENWEKLQKLESVGSSRVTVLYCVTSTHKWWKLLQCKLISFICPMICGKTIKSFKLNWNSI